MSCVQDSEVFDGNLKFKSKIVNLKLKYSKLELECFYNELILQSSSGNYISTMAPDGRDIMRSLLVSPQVTSAMGHAEVDSGSTKVQPDGSNSTFYHSCLKFFYRFGKSDGLSRLNVRLIRHDNHLTPPVWSTTNHVHGDWVGASADLVLHRDKPYKVLDDVIKFTMQLFIVLLCNSLWLINSLLGINNNNKGCIENC